VVTGPDGSSYERVAVLERWLDKRGLAEYLGYSVRSVERMIVDGMPHVVMLGRVRAKASEVEAWLEETGRLKRRGESIPTDSDPPGATIGS
jgi:excisionase family DNA binding protein